jgi:hypothetical protein
VHSIGFAADAQTRDVVEGRCLRCLVEHVQKWRASALATGLLRTALLPLDDFAANVLEDFGASFLVGLNN